MYLKMCDYLLQYFSENRGWNDWQFLALPIPPFWIICTVSPFPLSWNLSCLRELAHTSNVALINFSL